MKINDPIKIEGTNFSVVEFVSPERFKARPDRASRGVSWQLIQACQKIREHFGQPMTINNWYWGGNRTDSGLRDPNSAVGKPQGDHFNGFAADFLVSGMDTLDVRRELARNFDVLGITMIEDGMSGWNHVSVAWIEAFRGKLAIIDMKTNVITAYTKEELKNWQPKG
jgi:hypothetical protein